MVKHYHSNSTAVVAVRISDVQAMLLKDPVLCMLDYRASERALAAPLRSLVEKEFLKPQAHPQYFTRTDAGAAALLLFQHFGGVIAEKGNI